MPTWVPTRIDPVAAILSPIISNRELCENNCCMHVIITINLHINKCNDVNFQNVSWLNCISRKNVHVIFTRNVGELDKIIMKVAICIARFYETPHGSPTASCARCWLAHASCARCWLAHASCARYWLAHASCARCWLARASCVQCCVNFISLNV